MTLKSVLQKKVDTFVAESRINSEVIYDKLQNRVIDDFIIPSQLITFTPDYGGVGTIIKEDEDVHIWSLTPNSAYQVADRLGLPQTWCSKGVTGSKYQQESVSFAMNRYIENYAGKDDRFLFRNVGGQVRGFLSTSYKRLNTKEIFLMFITVAEELGLTLVGAYEGSSRDYLEVLDPVIFDIDTPNNGIVSYARGMLLKNSDFGDGKLELRSYWKKAVCLNGAIGHSYLKEIHLGSRLPQEFMFSIETINKDTETRALMVRDAMKYVFSPKALEFESKQICEASETKVELKPMIERLPKLGVSKSETKIVEEILLKHSEDDGIYGNPSMYLFANAVSAMARTANPERSRELQQIAGNFIFTRKPDELL